MKALVASFCLLCSATCAQDIPSYRGISHEW